MIVRANNNSYYILIFPIFILIYILKNIYCIMDVPLILLYLFLKKLSIVHSHSAIVN